MNVTNGAHPLSLGPLLHADRHRALGCRAQFARNHFPGNATIASLTDQLTDSVNFNNAIHPSLSGGIFLNMGAAGGGYRRHRRIVERIHARRKPRSA